MTIPLASVLLVDDDPDVLLTLRIVLENVGYTVTTCRRRHPCPPSGC